MNDNNGAKLLVVGRHGNTRWNVDFNRIIEIIRAGGTPERIIASTNPSLSMLGHAQSRPTGRWLKKNHPKFDRYYTADKLRHLQTVKDFDLPGSEWYVTQDLRERNFGIFDLLKVYRGDIPEHEALEKLKELTAFNHDFHNTPLAGESFASLSSRIGRLINKLKYDYHNEEVIFLTSEETAWAIKERIEHLGQKRYEELRRSTDPRDQFQNAGLTFWTRKDPKTGALAPNFQWTRNVVPWNMDYSTDWREFQPLKVNMETIDELIKHQLLEVEEELKQLEKI
ncbi:MAG: histidine phosphatase family protein [Candidatus Berkelbacteria bacterium]